MSKIFVDQIEPKTAGGTVTVTNPTTPSGKVLQCQTVTSSVDQTLGAGTDIDIPGNATPTVSQGITFLEKAITPISSTSIIIAQARIYLTESGNVDTGDMATMFKDSTLIGFHGNYLFVYSGLGSAKYQTPPGDMQAITSGHTAGTPVTFKVNVGTETGSTNTSGVRINNGAGGHGMSYTSFAIPSSLILWEVEQ